jgi:hypothetical protein
MSNQTTDIVVTNQITDSVVTISVKTESGYESEEQFGTDPANGSGALQDALREITRLMCLNGEERAAFDIVAKAASDAKGASS